MPVERGGSVVVAVEQGTEGNWTQPPFSGAIVDGYVWGRGTLDDKGSAMAILEAVDHGDRLEEMQARLDEAAAGGAVAVDRYDIDHVDVRLIVPFGRQDGLSLGLESRGTVTTETVGAAGDVVDRTSAPFEKTFVMRRATGDRWLNVAVLPVGADG